jgi:IS30 family transposase
MQITSDIPRAYRALTPEDREEIMSGLRKGWSRRKIARELKRNVSVISREIKANSTEDGRYQAFWANARSNR